MEVKEGNHQNKVKVGWFGGKEQIFGSNICQQQIGKVWWVGTHTK
jgi:hypothetical protein